MLSICLHLLLESGPARSLFISVPASPLSQRRERSAVSPAPFQMAFSQSQLSLRPTPPTPPDHWSAPAPPLAAPEPSASATFHPKLPVLRPRRFGAAPTQGQYIRNPPRTGTSPSRRGERYHHTHSRLHPASREQTLIRPSGVMRVPSSATQPAAAPLHPPHPSPSIRTPSSGSRASLFVFRDSGADAPAALHTHRKPSRHGVRKGKMRPAVRILPAAEQSAIGLHRSSPGLGTVSGSAVHRPSAQSMSMNRTNLRLF